ncbi:AAEL012721-PA [Aedes aegypti]|uniref:AAEL012721-PA n=1 Tax=Aedes aegypti TaxID=7159 RepID=Q16L95_AEDAE|nr:AAEL012721-PA [Aedes aegypti]
MISSKVKTFDSELYEAMHRPSSIEVTNTEMETLILPAELSMGDFSNNHINLVNLSNPENYQITYLDLSSNSLTNIDFISRLVNLEVLLLESNTMDHIPSSALRPLTKLKYLYLQYNSFASFPWNALASSIIHFDCYLSSITTAEFSRVSLPSLEYLNLEHNSLSTINVTELLQAAPKLKEAHLYNSHIDSLEMSEIFADLKANNVSFDEPYDMCNTNDYYERKFGICVQRRPDESTVSIGKAVLLSSLVIVTAVVFLYIVLLVFRHMNR